MMRVARSYTLVSTPQGLHQDDHAEHLLREFLGDSVAGHVGLFASIPDDDEE